MTKLRKDARFGSALEGSNPNGMLLEKVVIVGLSLGKTFFKKKKNRQHQQQIK